MTQDEMTAPTFPPAGEPCDHVGCAQPWKERVEFYDHDHGDHLVVRFVCARHAFLMLGAS
jgi:hypothetical protein